MYSVPLPNTGIGVWQKRQKSCGMMSKVLMQLGEC